MCNTESYIKEKRIIRKSFFKKLKNTANRKNERILNSIGVGENCDSGRIKRTKPENIKCGDGHSVFICVNKMDIDLICYTSVFELYDA